MILFSLNGNVWNLLCDITVLCISLIRIFGWKHSLCLAVIASVCRVCVSKAHSEWMLRFQRVLRVDWRRGSGL